MNLELTPEQEMLREAAASALAPLGTVANARAARDGEDRVDVWPVARQAGWSGLLISEERGGAGLGLYDAMLVLTECGRRLTGSGLIGHLAATLVLERAGEAGDERAREVLPALAAGEQRAALVFARPPTGNRNTGNGSNNGNEEWVYAAGESLADGSKTGPDVPKSARRLRGGAAEQLDLAGADLLVVPALADAALQAFLVDASADGVTVERQVRGDATRPLARLTLEGAEGVRLETGAAALTEAWHSAHALLAADALGVCEATLEMALAYAKDRQAFGRPIGSYQAVKHQLVEILHRIDKLRSLCVYVAFAAEANPEELPLATATARLAAEAAADYATRTCIAVHGGIGATWEHDAPWFWRRAQLSRLLLGGERVAADRIAAEAIARAQAGNGRASLADAAAPAPVT